MYQRYCKENVCTAGGLFSLRYLGLKSMTFVMSVNAHETITHLDLCVSSQA
jgi:hypothetical protein